MQVERAGEQRKQVMKRLEKVRKRIAVISGKGGVGKTTIAVSLAAHLAENNRVGLLDADIDCPNVNKFLGISEKFKVAEGTIFPIEKHGMKIVSMSSLQEQEDQAIIWRGPMISHAILQFIESVEWGELDYLIIDTPPGTSDAALTLMQLIKLDGVVIVSTPHSASVADARKAANMAGHMGVPVIGMVENMSGDVFGSVSLKKEISQDADRGELPDEKEIRKVSENIEKSI
jgi:ATP-binding protein involved in chromosome partitioning